MSIWTSILRPLAKTVAAAVIPGVAPILAVTEAMRTLPGAGPAPAPTTFTSRTGSIVPSLSRVPVPRLPPPTLSPRLAPPLPVPGVAGVSGSVCPSGFHLDKRTRTRCVRNRRMNPLNGRAAMRAIRRIKGARKMLQKIERQLPKRTTRSTGRSRRHITGPVHIE